MKYIDAEKLKDEIKHLKIDVYDEAHQFDLGARSSLTFLESFIDSLQQEQPDNWNDEYREDELLTRFAFYTYKDEDSVLYLSNVFVEETSRNKGFGTKILQAAEKVAETIGAITIRLKVKRNSQANDWYRKHGYGYLTFEGEYDWLEKNLEYLKPKQEQPDFPTTDEQVKEFLATHPKIEVPEKYKSPDWLFKNQEQPEVDLEKEIKQQIYARFYDLNGIAVIGTSGYAEVKDMEDIARHFAEWGAEHLAGVRKMISDDLTEAEENPYVLNNVSHAAFEYERTRNDLDARSDNEVVKRAFIAGAEWMKRKMMEGAVEGVVCILPGNVAYVEEKNNESLKQYILDNFNAGDEVRIIILPKE